jgi:hypothetical protein
MAQTTETRPKGAGSGEVAHFCRCDENKLLERRIQARKLRLQYLAARLHALGPKPLRAPRRRRYVPASRPSCWGVAAMIAQLGSLAAELGGVVSGGRVLAPGPGHSAADRSLQITSSPAAPDGFIAYSFAGDDWRDCRDYVKRRLGLPGYAPSRAAKSLRIETRSEPLGVEIVVRSIRPRHIDEASGRPPHRRAPGNRLSARGIIFREKTQMRQPGSENVRSPQFQGRPTPELVPFGGPPALFRGPRRCK